MVKMSEGETGKENESEKERKSEEKDTLRRREVEKFTYLKKKKN